MQNIENPQPRGKKVSGNYKLFCGSLIVLFILLVLFGSPIPKLIFDGRNVASPVSQCEISMEVGDGLSLFHYVHGEVATAPGSFLLSMKKSYKSNIESVKFLEKYNEDDVNEVKFGEESLKMWHLSNVDKFRSLLDCKMSKAVIKFRIACEKKTISNPFKNMKYENRRLMTNSEKRQLSSIVFGGNMEPFILEDLIPKVITERDLEYISTDIVDNNFQSVSLRLLKQQRWFMESVQGPHSQQSTKVDNTPKIFIFNERTARTKFEDYFGGLTIVALCFYLIYKIHANINSSVRTKFQLLHYSEMASPDRIMNIFNEMYMAREFEMFEIEEECATKIMLIHQSQENIHRWTRLNDGVYYMFPKVA